MANNSGNRRSSAAEASRLGPQPAQGHQEPTIHEINAPGASPMTALSAKQEALEAIQRLPDQTGMEEIMYRLYLLESVRRGREDAANGDAVPVEAVLREIDEW